jgi:hypothetical protein
LRDTQLHREFVSFFAEMRAGRRLLRRVLEEHEKPAASASVLRRTTFLEFALLLIAHCELLPGTRPH